MTATATTPREDELGGRLQELSVVTATLTELSAVEVRGHVAGIHAFLLDEVLAQANAEELALFPLIERMGGAAATAQLAVEHDTVRAASASLDALSARPMSAPVVEGLGGLLGGIETLLEGHLAHEADALEALADLDEEEREQLLATLAPTGGARSPRPPWLPEDLPRERASGAADLLEPEAMVGASCPPEVLALVRSAIAAAVDGSDADAWRAAVVAHSRYRLQVAGAEQCMRSAGLWPWNRTES